MRTHEDERVTAAHQRRRARAGLRQLAGSRTFMSVLSFGSKILARAGTFLLIAPLLGPTKQGIIVATSTWAATVLLLVGFGLQVRALRDIAIRPWASFGIVGGDLRLLALNVAPALLILIVVATAILPNYPLAIFIMMFAAGLGSVVSDYCSAVLRALDRYATEALVSASAAVLQTICIVGAAFIWTSVESVSWALLLSRAVCAIMSLAAIACSNSIRTSSERTFTPLTSTLRSAAPYFLDAALTIILSGLDIMILTKIADASIVGTYSAGSRLVQMFLVIPWIATNVVVPDLARTQGAKAFAGHIGRLSIVMGAIALSGALGLVFAGPVFSHVFLRDQYPGLDVFWPGFAALVLARFFEATLGIVLTGLGRLASRVYTQALCLCLVAGTMVWIVPWLGVSALPYAMAAAYVGIGLVYASRLRLQAPLLSRLAIIAGLLLLALCFVVCWTHRP